MENKAVVNLLKVLPRLAELIKEDEVLAERLQESLENLLDEYQEDDGFGTEGQLDPRGDQREGDWSLFGNVED